ncbi:ABC transporter ATP-binding protein [Streptomyces sp. NBC_01304]|uniref:ABC transporter ATP-binding protein n=1 Tax=Streptomyces sp. NBC_01304 TaxID=2903818 RepID=UPI002E167C6C|nr:ABC transporter ATP-binding protein [Streptomyces sp. NBC_01304]
MSAVLDMRQVSKTYGSGTAAVHALDAVDLAVRAGELVAVMGPSGSGKSTMLTIAGSLEEPTEGEVWIEGTALSELSGNERARLRRRHIGYVFQDFNLLAGLTAVENITMPLELDGIKAKQARREGMRALEELGLADRADDFPDELSGGMRQRVAIARALVGDRRLLLADEPTGALDSDTGEGVMRLIRAACRDGAAAVLVTHDAQLASWADRVVFVRDGRVIDSGPEPEGPEALLSSGQESDR